VRESGRGSEREKRERRGGNVGYEYVLDLVYPSKVGGQTRSLENDLLSPYFFFSIP